MGCQSRFTTSLPAVSPFINTGLCMCGGANPFISHFWIIIPLPWMNRYICIIDTIHFCSSLSVQFCLCLSLGAGFGGRRCRKGQGAPLPACAPQHHQHLWHGTTSLGHPNENRVGMATHNPRPPTLHHSALLRLLLQQLAMGVPGWWSPETAPRLFFTPSHPIRSCWWGSSAWDVWGDRSPGQLHIPGSTQLCTGAGAKPWQPRWAAGKHIFILWSACSESLWQPCPNNPVGQKCKQLHAQEVFLKMPFISRRGKIWDLCCGELTCWPFILKGHWCLKTAQCLNEITLGGPGLLRKEFFVVLKIRAWEYTDINTGFSLSVKRGRGP